MHEDMNGSWLGRLRPKSVDQYFLTEKCPFSHKRKFKTQNVKIALLVLLGGSVLYILVAGGSAERQWASEQSQTKAVGSAPTSYNPPRGNEGSPEMNGGWGKGAGGGITYSQGAASSASNRQYTASQIVRAGSEGSTSGNGLPMGTIIPVRLVNTLVSSDSSQPVIAEVLQDVIWRNSVLIPAGARAMGTPSFNDSAKRLQIRFHTFVYPEGDQHPVSGLALLQNGSSGLPGEYHSGAGQKEVGRFLGDFIGGLADGMKDRQAGGQLGITFEPGSIRNGVLTGITNSSLDEAKSFSEGMQNVKPYLEVPGGSLFTLFLEKEFAP